MEYTEEDIGKLFENNEHLVEMKFNASRRVIYTRQGHRILKSVFTPNGIRESCEVIKDNLWRRNNG